MYKRVGNINSLNARLLLRAAKHSKWKIVKGPDVNYATAPFGLNKFIKIPSNGWIKRHSDNGGRPEGTKTYHVVLSTNPQCINHSYCDPEQKIHLDKNGVYLFDTWPEHASFNRGETDRVHLVLDA